MSERSQLQGLESQSGSRRRKARLRLKPQIHYSLRWDDLDGVTGESGHGLRIGLRVWWQLRRGTWKDSWLPDFYDPSWCIDGHCGACDNCLEEAER